MIMPTTIPDVMAKSSKLEERMQNAFIPKIGETHEVTGKLTAIGECSQSEVPETKLNLKEHYFLFDGQHWKIPSLEYSRGSYKPVPIMGPGNKELEQGKTMATATVADDSSFIFKWNELIYPERTPFLRVRPISPNYADPDDPIGYKEVDAMRVFKIGRYALTPTGKLLSSMPEVELTFWGEETVKPLPPLQSSCFYLSG